MEEKLKADLKQAQLARDILRVSTLRLLISEINNAKIQKGDSLSGQEMINIIRRELKKRTEAAAGFRQGSREELAGKEEAEAEILKAYLPVQMTDEELTKVVGEVITEEGVTSLQDTGRVIGVVMGRVAGKADGGRVSVLVKEKLTN
ncbi:GatB/YqeY domain-containing protein [Candidatus Daviesbacteria bacterium]|nr:GatB/YqeY domain-containing protein [Candidatus Daviesbacteria bacterium]